MAQQKTREATRDRAVETLDNDPFEEDAGDLRQQAAAYASIAREAREECDKGVDAEQELLRRRNRSGE